jgi:hypothetical protein
LKEMIKDSIQIKSGAWQQPAIYAKPVLSVKPSVSVHSTAVAKLVTTVALTNNLNTWETVSVVHNVVNKPTPAIVVKPAVYHASTSISEDIIRELEDANIIRTRNNLSFRFTNDELIVNGIKQPDTLLQKLLKKYVTKPGETISISYSNQQ